MESQLREDIRERDQFKLAYETAKIKVDILEILNNVHPQSPVGEAYSYEGIDNMGISASHGTINIAPIQHEAFLMREAWTEN